MPGLFDWSATPASNTTVDGVNIAEGCPAGNVNNALRSIMALIRQTFSSALSGFLSGTSALPVANGGTGGTDQATARAGLGLGDVSTQNASTGIVATTGDGNYAFRARASATRPGVLQFVDSTGTVQRGNIYHDGNLNIYSDVGSVLIQGAQALGVSASSLAANGYTKLSNGLAIIWGSQFIGAGSTSFVSYPITLTTFSVVTVTGGTMSDVTRNGPFGSGTSTTGFTLNNNSSIGSTAFWIAVGV